MVRVLLFPLEMDFEKKMQLAEIGHLKFALETRLQLVDDVHIACQDDKVAYIYDYNHNVVATL